MKIENYHSTDSHPNENNNTYSCSSLHDEAVYIDFLEIAEFLEKPIGWGATMGP